jgi:hypothetical protein
VQDFFVQMLGCDFEMAAHVVTDQIFKIRFSRFFVREREIVPEARSDMDLSDARNLSSFLE